MTTQVVPRLDPAIFRLPVERIRDGYYSDAYFVYTKQLLEGEGRHPRVTMQIFQKHDSILGGVDEAIAVLKTCAGRRGPDDEWNLGWSELEVCALYDGDHITPWETVMTIEGDYAPVRTPGDGLSGLHGPPLADHAQRRGSRGRGAWEGDLLLPGAA